MAAPSALFTDNTPDNLHAAINTGIMERRPLLLMPVPHEQPWAATTWTGQPVEPETPRRTHSQSETNLPASSTSIVCCLACQHSEGWCQ
jgi:hypothetical protein